MIASSYAYAAAADPDKLPYDLSFFKTSASIVGTSMATWLAHRRSKAALPVACATAVGAVALGVANKVKKGAYVTRTWANDSLKERVFNKAMPIAHAAGSAALVGLTVASRIRANKNNLPTLQGPLLSSPWYPLARKLGLYFMSFSLLGHWVEILFCLGIKHGIFKGGYDRENHMLWDQWLFPFPAEGTAAVLADLALVPAKSAIQKGVSTLVDAGRIPCALATPLALGASFLVNQAVCTSVDYGAGMVANRNYELWDYRDMRFNFQGQVCLQNSLFYSILATWGVWQLLPVLEKLMKRIGDTALDGALVGLGSWFVLLELLYQVLPNDRG